MIKKGLLLLMIFFEFCFNGFSQDPQSSHFYANPLYHNPAFTGSLGFPRISLNMPRIQWIRRLENSSSAYDTEMVSFDSFSKFLEAGFGIQAIRDRQGNGFVSRELSFLGSRSIRLNSNPQKRLNSFWVGGQATWKRRSIDAEDLKFVYQYNASGFDNTIPVTNYPSNDVYIDKFWTYSGGIIFTSRHEDEPNAPSLVLGVAAHHLEEWGSAKDSKIPLEGYLKTTVHGSITIPSAKMESGQKIKSITYTVFYRKQGKSQQMDVLFTKNYQYAMFGAAYRGRFSKRNSDAVSLLGGFRGAWWRANLSYDFPFSNLKTAGSFELSLGLVLNFKYDLGLHKHPDTNTEICRKYGYYWLF